jgi:hypothetical protein
MFASDVYTARKRDVVMGATMPFSSSTVDPSLMDAMRAAFNRVCDVLQLSCDRADPLTEVVVTKIVDLAKAGERDPEKLCFAVLADLDMPLQEAIPRSAPERAPPPMTSVAAE